jgi:hypothetical protein
MKQLIGRFIFDPNGTDLRVTGFTKDGKVSLTNDDTGVNTTMVLQDVVALENNIAAEAYAMGLTDEHGHAIAVGVNTQRLTCAICEQWDLFSHDHFWLEDNYVNEPPATGETFTDQTAKAIREEIVRLGAAMVEARNLGRTDVVISYHVRIDIARTRLNQLAEAA